MTALLQNHLATPDMSIVYSFYHPFEEVLSSKKKHHQPFYDTKKWLKQTIKSQPSSRGLTLHIIFTTLRVSMSIGSGVTDFIDSAVSGDMARGRGGGGCLAANAVKG